MGGGGEMGALEFESGLRSLSFPLQVFDLETIASILPHRYPFALVDKALRGGRVSEGGRRGDKSEGLCASLAFRALIKKSPPRRRTTFPRERAVERERATQVIEYEAGKRAVGIKCITNNEPQFTGHFPDRPIMPGVMQIEALAQLAGIVCLQMARQTRVSCLVLLRLARLCVSLRRVPRPAPSSSSRPSTASSGQPPACTCVSQYILPLTKHKYLSQEAPRRARRRARDGGRDFGLEGQVRHRQSAARRWQRRERLSFFRRRSRQSSNGRPVFSSLATHSRVQASGKGYVDGKLAVSVDSMTFALAK